MNFLRIQYFFLIWVVPVLALVYLYGWRKRSKILNAFAAHTVLKQIVPTGMSGRRRIKAVLILSALLLLVAAMAGPQYGFQWQRIERQGIDIVLALDCSRSMLATDIQPTRLDRAKREIYDLLTMLQGDRVGLVAFSGTAFLQCPLTMDYSAFHLFLDVLTPDYLPVGGSDLAAAVQTAQNAFDPKSKADRAIILITDGENTGHSDPMAVSQAAQKAGTKLFCIGVGSTDGVPIPNAQGGFKKDADGQIILSRLDQGLLTRMALSTGGTYVQSVAGDMDLETIYRDQIRAKLDAATVESDRKQVWYDRFQWPLAMAVALLILAGGLPTVQRPLTAIALTLLLCAANTAVEAGPLQQGYQHYAQGEYDQALQEYIQGQLQAPDDPAVLYNLGNAYYKMGDFKAASQHYGHALSKADEQLKPKLLYNLGNSAYRQGKLQEAIQNYEAALKLSPEDRQAKENLAFVEKQLQQQQDKPSQDGQDNKDSDTQKGQNGQPQAPKPGEGRSRQPESQPKAPQQSDADATPPSPAQAQAEPQQKPPQEQSDAPSNAKGQNPANQPAAAQMLNRLKDKPGKAMMPAYGKQQVDKDW